MTDREDEIAFLDEQIKLGHQMIFVKDNEKVVGSDAIDPLAAIKKKAVEDYLKQQERANDPNRDMGNSVNTVSESVQTSKSIATIAVGSKSK